MKKITWVIGFLVVLAVWMAGAIYIRHTRTDLPPAVIERLYPLPQQVFTAARELPWRDALSEASLSTSRVLMGF